MCLVVQVAATRGLPVRRIKDGGDKGQRRCIRRLERHEANGRGNRGEIRGKKIWEALETGEIKNKCRGFDQRPPAEPVERAMNNFGQP